MTTKQKIELRLSEVRARLNEISGLEGDAYTAEVRTEQDTLMAEFRDLEKRHQAAIMAEGEDQAKAAGAFGNGSGEEGERGRLLREVRLADYLGPAAAGSGLTGRAAELNAALEVPIAGGNGAVAIPWAVLAGPEPERRAEGEDLERRAFTTTANYAGGVMQRPILQRLFGPGILDTLGVRIDTVPAGRSEWPLITGGVAPAQKAEGAAADAAVAAGFGTETLRAKRLTGRYEYTHEMAAQVVDLEQALRRDLADAVMSQMSALVMAGNEATNPQEPDGFLTKLTAPASPSDVADYAAYAGVHALAVDGIHATMETEVSSVVHPDVYTHAASVYQAGSGEAGSEALKRRSMSCMASVYATAAQNNVASGNILHAAGLNGGPMRGDSVAAMWPTLEVIRDIYSQASQGVVLTWVTLWDAETAFRAAAYRRVAFRIGS